MSTDEILRDFLYLDIDRVRSLVAQLQQGTPEAVEKQVSQHGSGGIKVVEYAYESTTKETRSIHHYMFSILEGALEDTGRLVTVNEEFGLHGWTTDELSDGLLVLIEGFVRIVDFQKLTEAMESLPHLVQVINQTEKASLKQELQAGAISPQEYKKLTAELPGLGMDKKDFKGIVGIVEQMFTDTLRVKMFPLSGHRDHYFTGSLNVANLQQPRGNIWLSGGVESKSRWWAMGIVNQVNADPDAAAQVTGSTMEDKLEALYLMFAAINKVTTSIEFPAVSFTPIAVYRNI